MTFVAEQLNTVEPPARWFLMDARRGGLPVDVLHRYADGEASMRVRLLSVLPMAGARGPQMTRAETVTLFNDLALFAPGELVGERLSWEAVDDRTVRGTYTVGPHTVSATLHFGEDGRLVDFVSDDRLAASADGTTFEAMRWSTPIPEVVTRHGLRVPARGEARWHPPEGDFAYLEAQRVDHAVNGPLR